MEVITFLIRCFERRLIWHFVVADVSVVVEVVGAIALTVVGAVVVCVVCVLGIVCKMLCQNPYVDKDGMAYPCGQCMPCRFNRRRVWTHRIMLEAGCHEFNSFITLTYSDDYVPRDGSLCKEHLQRWLKRIRKEVAPVSLRFFGVGEYGDSGDRPHYHVALFGYEGCRYGKTRASIGGRSCCERCDLVRDTWGMGGVMLGSLEVSSAQYICGYVTKKMTHSDHPDLRGREPEFSRMSLKPGIGFLAVADVASTLMEFNLDTSQGDVPVTLRHGRRELPLGRYMRRKLREAIGKPPEAPPSVVREYQESMLELRKAARLDEESPSFKGQILKSNKQRYLQFEGRRKLKPERKKL